MAKETEVAKQLLSQGKKSQALICLKKKKLQESMLAKSQAQLENVSTMVAKELRRICEPCVTFVVFAVHVESRSTLSNSLKSS